MKNLIFIITIFLYGCQSVSYQKTIDYLDFQRFLGKWYVIAGRTTFLEKGAYNSTEEYSWDEEKKQIGISFHYFKDSFDGPKKSVPQKGWIYNQNTKAHWKVSPYWWPIKFDYLVIDLDPNYNWVVVGVPNQNYVWIMSRQWQMNDQDLEIIINRLKSLGYNSKDIKRIPQKWN